MTTPMSNTPLLGTAYRRPRRADVGPARMRLKRERVLAVIGIGCLIAAGALWGAVHASIGGGTLDFYPAIAFVGLSLIGTAGIAEIRKRRVAISLAWLLRAANTVFLLVTAFMVFLLLPVNQNANATTAQLVIANGILAIAVCLGWWLANREIRRSLKDGEAQHGVGR